ncbi:MAG: YggS family pyridoxal phosphate-dependent enzyme, partial [Alphaproteobacteria bacterium]|nr:YggS family pyridoxal phosphate-dependent enzyme [Alphaproteobacteria bacterium]
MLSFSAAPLEAIQQTLAAVAKASAQDSGKNPQPVTLIAVSKTQPRAVVDQAMAAGVMVFGENRVQEAQQKFSAMHPRPQLHLIGPLQTNKVGAACALFDYIHTLDRPSLIMALAKEKQKCGKIPQLLIQVNVGRELQKAGVLPEHFPALWQLAQNHQLPVVGLMCIPP